MISSSSFRPTTRFLLASILAGLACWYADTLAAVTTIYWLGWRPTQQAQLASGAVVYVAIVGVLGVPFTALASRLPASAERAAIVGPSAAASALLATLGWSALSTTVLTIAIVGLLVLMGGLAIADASRRLTPGGYVVAWSCAFGAGPLMAEAACRATTVPDRAPFVIGVTLAWTLATAACLVAVQIPRASASRWVRMTTCATGIGLLSIVLAWWGGGAPSSRRTERPNLLLLTADTMRADYTSAYGGDVATPYLEALAESGTLFLRHYVVAPWTVPSISALFASKYAPSLTRDQSNEAHEREIARYSKLDGYWAPEGSMMDVLRGRGYRTAAFVTNPTMRSSEWLLEDFDEHQVLDFLGSLMENSGPFSALPLLEARLARWLPTLEGRRPVDYTWRAQRYARDFLAHAGDAPFFLWVHFIDPHTPYNPPDRLRTWEDPYDFFPLLAKPEHHRKELRPWIKAMYEAEIRYVDEAVGRILSTLEDIGLADDTYVVFFSDHGEELFDSGRFGHGMTLREEQVRVPLIFAGPGIEQARRIERPVTSLDVMPTLADLAGVAPPPGWRGRSLRPVLTETRAPSDEPVFFQATGLLPRPVEPLQGMVHGGFKLVRGMRTRRRWLYDLTADPGERRDLASLHPERLADMTDTLNRWARTFPETMAELDESATSRAAEDRRIRQLRELGYLE